MVCVGMVADDDGRWEGNVQKRRYAFLGGCLFVFYFYFFFPVVLSLSLSFFLFSLLLFHFPRSATVVSILLCFVCFVCECV